MSKPSNASTPNGIGTLIFGIVFTAIGGGLLIEHATGAHVWRYLWRLWPVLLITMGIMLIIFRKAAMKARYVLLALLIIAVGSAITASHRGVFARWGRTAFSWSGDLEDVVALISRSWPVAADLREVERFSRALPAHGASSVSIENPNGRVTLTGQEQDQVQIRAIRYGRGETTKAARHRARKVHLETSRSGETLIINVAGPHDAWRQSRIDLEITTPPNLDVNIGTASGPVEVQGMKRSVDVQAISGGVAIAGGSAAKVSTASGTISIRDVRGPVKARSISGSVTLEDLSGEMTLSAVSGSIHATGLRGALSATTISGSLVLDDFAGSPINLKTTSGDLNVAFSEPIAGDFFARSISGSMHASLPPESDCTVHLSSISGGIHEDLPLRNLLSERHHVRGVLGQGRGRLELQSISGSISVNTGAGEAEAVREAISGMRRRSGVPSPPSPPKPPAPARPLAR
jgi:hypothetical protein